MAVTPTLRVEIQFTTGIWAHVTADVRAAPGIHVRYGINGNGPTDCVAETGECTLSLRNDAGNSGGLVGYYSPLHANVRSGWTYGIPMQVVFSHPDDVAISVSSITRSGTTATVTTASAHGRATNDYMTIAGADQADYNGTWKITVTGGSTFTFTVLVSATTPATGTMTARRAYVKHRGKVRMIDPDPGAYGPQNVQIVSYDGMRDLGETVLREVGLQTNASESVCLTAVLDALPANSQPVARSIDTGVDTYPYAFDDLQGGVQTLGVIQDIAVSSYMLIFMKGDGTFIAQARDTRALSASAYTFNNVMHGLRVPSDLANVYNLVRITISKRTISAAATEELYTMPTGASLEIPSNATITPFTDYSDPDDRQVAIGGSNVVTALVSGTHYAANSAADGSGSDLSASITASLTAWASTAKWTLTNTAAQTAYIRTLKVVGKALRRPGPQVFESKSTQSYGTRPLELELKYQSDGRVAQSYAEYLENQYRTFSNQVGELELLGNYSTDFLTQVLAREPGDVITVTEAQTGLSLIDAVIHSVELDIVAGPIVRCRWGLARAAVFQPWLAGTVGRSEAGTTTIPGF